MAKATPAPARARRGTAGADDTRPQSSAAKVAANRRNAKKSRGRPPARLPVEVLAELGPVPTDPIAVREWLLRASAVIWRCEASGEISGEYASRLRNGLASIAKFLPATSSPPASASSSSGDDDEDDDEDPHPGGPRAERVDPHTPIAR
jgi:hypothetical protein